MGFKPKFKKNIYAVFEAHLRTLNHAIYCRLSCSMARRRFFWASFSHRYMRAYWNYKMFNRQIRFKNNDNYFFDSRMPRIFSLYFTSFAYLNFWIFKLLDFTISHFLHIWTFRFLNNSIIGFYYFTSFGFLNFWILVFSLLSFLLCKKINVKLCKLCRLCHRQLFALSNKNSKDIYGITQSLLKVRRMCAWSDLQ